MVIGAQRVNLCFAPSLFVEVQARCTQLYNIVFFHRLVAMSLRATWHLETSSR